jgi:hypothetical protein
MINRSKMERVISISMDVFPYHNHFTIPRCAARHITHFRPSQDDQDQVDQDQVDQDQSGDLAMLM